MKILPIVTVTLLLTACGATPNTAPLQPDAGFRLLSNAEWSKLSAGNTLEGLEHGSYTYLREDGVKLIKQKSGDIIVREWYLDDNGIMCQTMMSSGKLSCLADRESFIAAYNDSTNAVQLTVNGNTVHFILSPGNSAGISESQ